MREEHRASGHSGHSGNNKGLRRCSSSRFEEYTPLDVSRLFGNERPRTSGGVVGLPCSGFPPYSCRRVVRVVGVCRVDHLDRSGKVVDIIVAVMWLVEVEPEVEQWIESLPVREFAKVVAAVERLAEDGSRLRFPASRALGGGSSSFASASAVSRGGSRSTSRTTGGSFC